MDEAIISLADRVISILKQRKIVELSDLVKETGENEEEIKLIINLLEKEEMVDVGYSLTKVLISWNDEADRILMKMKKNQKIISLNSDETLKIERSRNGKTTSLTPIPINENEKEILNDEAPKFNIFKEKTKEEIEAEIESIEKNLKSKQINKNKVESKHKEIRRESSYKIGAMAVKDIETNDEENLGEKDKENFEIFNSKAENILKRSEAVEKHASQKTKIRKQNSDDSDIDREIKDIERNILLRISGETENGDSAHIISLENTDIVKSAKTKSISKDDIEKSESQKQRLLNKYRSEPNFIDKTSIKTQKNKEKDELKELEEKLNQIVNKRAEIVDLNKQKTILFDTTHPELKSKLSAQIEAMESIISEKEGRLNELKNKIQILPENIIELNRALQSLREKQMSIDSVFNSTMNQLNEIKNKIHEVKDDYFAEFTLIKNQIIEQEKELIKINDIYSSLKDKEKRLINSIQFVKDNILKSQEELMNLEDQLEKFRSSSKSIELKIEETNKVLRSLNRQFENYINKIKELDDFENEIKQIQKEYMDSKEKIDSKINDYTKEILAISKSIELEATSRYLQELEKMTAEAEDSINSLLYSENELNKRIENKKKELAQLIEEAKRMQRSLAMKELREPKVKNSYNLYLNPEKINLMQSNFQFNEDFIDSDKYEIKEMKETDRMDVEVKTLDSSALNQDNKSNSKLEEIKESLSNFLAKFNRKLGKK
ncbi:MAG: hypothetical protein QXO35_01260 [Candidatus Micrarchaeia archaeon]